MLVFHPDLGIAHPDIAEENEVIICLDCSSSMEGVTFLQAKQIALYALSLVGEKQKINVVKFGSGECPLTGVHTVCFLNISIFTGRVTSVSIPDFTFGMFAHSITQCSRTPTRPQLVWLSG